MTPMLYLFLFVRPQMGYTLQMKNGLGVNQVR